VLTYCNEEGLFADFHANRHTFISNLGRAGISPKLAQTLARHSDPKLTMNIYTHVDATDQAGAIEKLAPPPPLGSLATTDASGCRWQTSDVICSPLSLNSALGWKLLPEHIRLKL
jgi:hypothetical protein